MAASLQNLSRYVVPAATVAGAVIVWELASRVLRIPKFIMPAPSEIATEAWEWRYRFIGHSWVTLYETLGGFALSIVVGVPLATLIVYSPAMRRALYPLIVLLQAVPKIAVAPVLLLVIGYGEIPKMIVAFLVAFFPIVVDTATGLAATPPELLELSRSYRASAFKTFVKVRFPMALPFVFSGLKGRDHARGDRRSGGRVHRLGQGPRLRDSLGDLLLEDRARVRLDDPALVDRDHVVWCGVSGRAARVSVVGAGR
jgi:ABC-type nitrate/sulfonate/bicarbonate transport system permease component